VVSFAAMLEAAVRCCLESGEFDGEGEEVEELTTAQLEQELEDYVRRVLNRAAPFFATADVRIRFATGFKEGDGGEGRRRRRRRTGAVVVEVLEKNNNYTGGGGSSSSSTGTDDNPQRTFSDPSCCGGGGWDALVVAMRKFVDDYEQERDEHEKDEGGGGELLAALQAIRAIETIASAEAKAKADVVGANNKNNERNDDFDDDYFGRHRIRCAAELLSLFDVLACRCRVGTSSYRPLPFSVVASATTTSSTSSSSSTSTVAVAARIQRLLLRGVDVAFGGLDDNDEGAGGGTGATITANDSIGSSYNNNCSVCDGGAISSSSSDGDAYYEYDAILGLAALKVLASSASSQQNDDGSQSQSQPSPNALTTMKLWSVASVASSPSSSTAGGFATTTTRLAVGETLSKNNDVQDDDANRNDADVTKRDYSLWNYDTSGRTVQIEANVDDATPERMAYTAELLLQKGGAGAYDAWITPVVMKKGRPGYTLHCLCARESVHKALEVLFRNGATLGARMYKVDRATLRREIITVHSDEWGTTTADARARDARSNGIVASTTANRTTVDVKIGYLGRDVVSAKAEFEHCRAVALATGRPIQEIADRAVQLAREQLSSLRKMQR